MNLTEEKDVRTSFRRKLVRRSVTYTYLGWAPSSLSLALHRHFRPLVQETPSPCCLRRQNTKEHAQERKYMGDLTSTSASVLAISTPPQIHHSLSPLPPPRTQLNLETRYPMSTLCSSPVTASSIFKKIANVSGSSTSSFVRPSRSSFHSRHSSSACAVVLRSCRERKVSYCARGGIGIGIQCESERRVSQARRER